MAKTLQADMAELVQLFGWTPAGSRGKYSSWSHSDHPKKIFLGRNGAIRVGSATRTSISYTDKRDLFIKRLVEGKIGD